MWLRIHLRWRIALAQSLPDIRHCVFHQSLKGCDRSVLWAFCVLRGLLFSFSGAIFPLQIPSVPFSLTTSFEHRETLSLYLSCSVFNWWICLWNKIVAANVLPKPDFALQMFSPLSGEPNRILVKHSCQPGKGIKKGCSKAFSSQKIHTRKYLGSCFRKAILASRAVGGPK